MARLRTSWVAFLILTIPRLARQTQPDQLLQEQAGWPRFPHVARLRLARKAQRSTTANLKLKHCRMYELAHPQFWKGGLREFHKPANAGDSNKALGGAQGRIPHGGSGP